MMPHPLATEWKGEDAFLIGGGSSLEGFSFGCLKGKNVIGCNDAYRLGVDVISAVLFGDASFFHKFKWEMENCGVRVFHCAPALVHLKTNWLISLRRERSGLCEDGGIAWNASTGAAAINLAYSLGASRIFLLGYDCGKRADGKSHWHNHREKKIQEESYNRFIQGFQCLFAALSQRPEVQVLNVTNGSSKLPSFNQITFAEFDNILKQEEVMA